MSSVMNVDCSSCRISVVPAVVYNFRFLTAVKKKSKCSLKRRHCQPALLHQRILIFNCHQSSLVLSRGVWDYYYYYYLFLDQDVFVYSVWQCVIELQQLVI